MTEIENILVVLYAYVDYSFKVIYKDELVDGRKSGRSRIGELHM